MIDTRSLMMRLNESVVENKNCDNKVKESKVGEPKIEEGAKVDEATDDFDYVGDLAYKCPKCNEAFASDIELFDCICPECGERVAPEFLGEIEDIEDKEELDEAFMKVVGGKVVKFAKKAKAGFKRVKGKYVKLTQKELRARRKAVKKAGKSAHRAAANIRRAKSLMKRQKMLANMDIDTHKMSEMFNKALENIYSGDTKEKYHVPVVEGIEEVTLSENDSRLDFKCDIKYDDNVRESKVISINVEDCLVNSDLFGESQVIIEFSNDKNLLIPESVELV